MLYKGNRSTLVRDGGSYRATANLPGTLVPNSQDHGCGALALVVEAFVEPGAFIAMHEHVEEEIISYVAYGAMRHSDHFGNKLVTDADHLMVMNAGRSFWHEERTLDDDPPMRMLQIFVRPQALGLEPGIQYNPLHKVPNGCWRYVFGSFGSDAPFFVRNDVHCYDIQLETGISARLPRRSGWVTYFYVFSGRVVAEGEIFEESETGLLTGEDDLVLLATETALVVAFVLNPMATITRAGTSGDKMVLTAFAEEKLPQ